jgi:hypothetical protein
MKPIIHRSSYRLDTDNILKYTTRKIIKLIQYFGTKPEERTRLERLKEMSRNNIKMDPKNG